MHAPFIIMNHISYFPFHIDVFKQKFSFCFNFSREAFVCLLAVHFFVTKGEINGHDIESHDSYQLEDVLITIL